MTDTMQRPRTRGECRGAPRPCPWVSCAQHLALVAVLERDRFDRHGDTREMERFDDLVLARITNGDPTCAMDVADHSADSGGEETDVVAKLLGVSVAVAQNRERAAKRSLLIKLRAREVSTPDGRGVETIPSRREAES